MVVTSVAVICFRKESIWERREAATCVGREAKRQRKARRHHTILYSGNFTWFEFSFLLTGTIIILSSRSNLAEEIIFVNPIMWKQLHY